MLKRITSPFALVALVTSSPCLAAPASAIGFGAGLEGGGFVGAARLTSGGITQPGLYGGGGALLLSLEVYDEGLLRVQTLGRIEGNGFGVVTDLGGGAGGAGGGELLLRLGFNTPVVEPFLEVGGGAMVGGGGGTADLSGIGQAVDSSVAGTMWAPAGYVGGGLTMALPLLPYFELRLGSHIGGLLPLDDAAPPIRLSGIEALSARAEVWLGVGYRI
jgi:hypothetical protein